MFCVGVCDVSREDVRALLWYRVVDVVGRPLVVHFDGLVEVLHHDPLLSHVEDYVGAMSIPRRRQNGSSDIILFRLDPVRTILRRRLSRATASRTI